MKRPVVSVVMGSDSDLSVMKEAIDVFVEFKIPYEVLILSAHRTPEATAEFAKSGFKKGIKVIIAAAGGAAHLAGVIAAYFPLPVIGVPIKSSTLNGVDSLYSIVQMPPGVPVATVAINGAKNAALLAIQIIAISDKKMLDSLQNYKKKLAKAVVDKSNKLKDLGVKNYLAQMKK